MLKRMTFKKQTIISLIGILLAVVSATSAVLWETVGRETYLYKNVLIVNRDIKKGDVIKDNMLSYIKLEEDKIISNPLENKKDVLNMAAKQFIAKNSQLTKEYLDTPDIVLSKEQFIFSVPTDWVKAMPSSIRRRDKVLFYELSPKIDAALNPSSTSSKQNAENGMPVATQESTATYPAYVLKDDSWLKTFDIKSFVTTTDGKIRPPLIIATVAYVKDNANREVVTTGDQDRFDGSSQIGHLEIIITLKELRALELSVTQGNHFVILGKEE